MPAKNTAVLENTKRSQILETAQKLFVEQGYDGVSMDALAQAVPVSKRTLYNHFDDKKALFTAVMQNRCIFIARNIEHILMQDERDIARALTRMGESFLAVVLHPHATDIYRTAIAQLAHFPDLGKLFYESGPLRCKQIFAEYLKRLHEQKRLHVPDAKHAADVFFSMLTGRMQMRLLLGVEKRIKAGEIKAHIAYAVGVFLYGQQVR